jgi:starvation-inducible DNA-binding protein
MPELSNALRAALANTFAFYFKAHAFHWNVVGSEFPQLHAFFGAIYEDAHDAVDDLAERLRTIGEHAPFGVSEMLAQADIEDADGDVFSSSSMMVKQLQQDNEAVIASLNVACAFAMKAGKAGLCNFLQDRIDKHAKWGWQLAATASI